MRTLYLCGAGNSEGVRLALRVREADRRWDRIVLLDDDPTTRGTSLLEVEVAGPFDLLAHADPARDEAVNLVARTTAGRHRAGERIASFGVPVVGLVAPGVDTLGADLASDVLVYPGAHIGPEVVIRAGSVVFMGAVVGHESSVGPGCVIAANAVLNARVELGELVYVGAGATVLPEIQIGARATVGAGSTVVSAVPPGATVLGVPARELGQERTTGSIVPAPPSMTSDRLEAALVEAWSGVLGVSEIPTDARVFDLGATSLDALRVSERLHRVGGVDVALVDLYRFGTVRELARHLTARTSASSASGPGTRCAPVADALRSGASAEGPMEGQGEDVPVEAITEIFRQVLDAPDLGPDSHFFELGGTSTTAEEVCGMIRQATGETVCFMQVARFPTPRELAAHLEMARGGPPDCPARGMMSRMIHRRERQRS